MTTLRFVTCRRCGGEVAVEELGRDYEREEDMPAMVSLLCFDCAAVEVGGKLGLSPRVSAMAGAGMRMLGQLMSPAASFAKVASSIATEQAAEERGCLSCRHKPKTRRQWHCRPLDLECSYPGRTNCQAWEGRRF
jgi:hypothetical protein